MFFSFAVYIRAHQLHVCLNIWLRSPNQRYLSSHQDCGGTIVPYRACCPANTFCPSQYNIDVSHVHEFHKFTPHKLTMLPSAAPHLRTVLEFSYKTLSAQINLGIYMITGDTFVASKDLQDMLPLRTVTAARSQVMHFKVERSCFQLSAPG